VSWLKNRSGATTYLILRDIFPQNAVDLGLMNKKGLIHYFFRKKEKKLYALSDFIGCMSQGNISYIKEHNPGLDLEKLHLLPNWSDLIPLYSDEEIYDLRKKENLLNKFVIIFGGNIGLPQKLDNIVRLAEACVDREEFIFLIFGKGSERTNLDKLVAEKSLKNLQVRDSLQQTKYMKWVQMADVGLISLSEKFTIPNIPSKALSYYNTRTPILASIDENTDFGEILESMKTGFWAPAGKTEELKNKLVELYENEALRKQMGENGFNYMKNNLSSNHAYKTVINQIAK
jgi:glycosyltransferase involved in cell wall biosynthesis